VEHPARVCLAEIVVTVLDGSTRRGSGYLVESGWVLTAAHVLRDAARVGVWLGAPAGLCTGGGYGVDLEIAQTIADADLALVPVPPAATPPGFVRPLLGALDRGSTAGVPAVVVGFPWFKLRPALGRPGVDVREVDYSTGRIIGGSNPKTGTLELRVEDAPGVRPDPEDSPWEGVSGGPVFAHGCLVGVVGQHFPSEGAATLTVRPLHLPDDVATHLDLPPDPVCHHWAALLPQLSESLPVVTPPTQRALSAQRAQAAATRLLPETGVLIARDVELRDLAIFATGEKRWRWMRAKAFAGKTALLAHFALHPPEEVDVVACFLRSTTGENTAAGALKVLNEQLVGLLNRPGYQPPTTVAELLSDFQDDLLPAAARAARQQGRRLLLLIDGLDEYAPNESLTLGTWLPSARSLPEGVSMLVASRTGVPIPLPESHPLAGPSAQHRLAASEVAFQIRDLALAELDAALRGQGRDELKYQVAGCMAATGGRISLADLNTWLLRRGNRSEADSVEYLADQVASWFHRTLYTTDDPSGSGEQVLVFAHETLTTVFENRFAGSLPALRNELHDWAEQYRQAGWPFDTSTYLLTGYSHLLVAIREVDRLTRLALDPARHDRLRALTGADAVALWEIRAAHELHLKLTEIDLLILGRLTRHRNRLETRAGSVPVNLPAVWVLLGQIPRAIGSATAIPNPENRARALASVVEALAAAGQSAQAQEVAETITDLEKRASALARVVEALAAAGQPEQARRVAEQVQEVAETITDPRLRAWALVSVVEALAAAGQPEQARRVAKQIQEVAETITDPRLRAWALASVVEPLAAAGQPEQAQEVAETITDPRLRAWALVSVVEALAAAGQPEQARRVAKQIQEVAETITDPRLRAWALVSVVEARAAAGQSAQAQEVAETITDPYSRAWALVSVVEALAAAGQSAQAQEVAETITDPGKRASALVSVVEALAAAGQPAQAQEVAETITDPGKRASALASVVGALAAAGQPEQACRVAVQVQEVAETITDLEKRASALASVVGALAAAGQPEQACRVAVQVQEVAETITDPRLRAWALARVVEALAAAGQPEQACRVAKQVQEVAETITDPYSHAWALVSVVEARAAAGQSAQAQEVAETITGPGKRASALARVVEALAVAGQPEQARRVAKQVQGVAETITDPCSRAWALVSVVEALAAAGQSAQAQEVAEDITSPYLRAWALVSVVEALAAAGQSAQAQEVAETITDPGKRASALARVVGALAAAGQPEQACRVAKQVQGVAETITDPYSHAWALVSVVEALAAAGQPEQACRVAEQVQKVAETITGPGKRASALARVVEALAAAGQPEQARRVAKQVQGVAETITDPYSHAWALVSVVEALAAAGQPEQACRVAEQVQGVAETITDPGHRAQLLSGLPQEVGGPELMATMKRTLGTAWLTGEWLDPHLVRLLATCDFPVFRTLAEEELSQPIATTTHRPQGT
jgi:uncharacterized protein YjeT (DUF2065 family)